MRGGARTGSGRKPAARVVALPGTVVEPADLGDAERTYWRLWAPLARDAGTLTAQTVPAFRLLCESQAVLQRYRATVAQDGDTYVKVTIDGAGQEHRELKAHPLIAKAHGLAYRVEQLFARFGLAPTGRPVQAAPKKTSKWAAFGIGPTA